MAIQSLHLPPINKIFPTIFSTIACHLQSLVLSALSLFKPPPPHSDDHRSTSGNHIIIFTNSTPSLIRVPIHVITTSIKTKLPVIPYSSSTHRHAGSEHPACMVCLDCIDDCHLIRELINCDHVFHLECFDQWVDFGHVKCPLCRSMLLPQKKLLSYITTTETTTGAR